MRSIQDILESADRATTKKELTDLRVEIAENDKRNYPIIMLEFAEEHFKMLYSKLDK